MATAADTLQRAYDNYARIWLMCTELIANPTQARIDAVVAAAGTAGIVTPKPTYSKDGVSYDWTGYQTQLGTIMKSLREQMIAAAGPYEVRSVAR